MSGINLCSHVIIRPRSVCSRLLMQHRPFVKYFPLFLGNVKSVLQGCPDSLAGIILEDTAMGNDEQNRLIHLLKRLCLNFEIRFEKNIW